MMSLWQLAPNSEIENAQIKLALEIQKAKAFIDAMDTKLDWNSSKWDLTDLTERVSPTAGKVVVIIAPLKTNNRYPQVWADLLLLLVVWLLEEKLDTGEKWKSSYLIQIIKSGRRLIDRIIKNSTAKNITQVTPTVIEDHLTDCSRLRDTGAVYITTKIIARLVARGVAPQLSAVTAKTSKKAFKGPSSVQASTWSEIVSLGCAYQQLRSHESPIAERADFNYMRYYIMLASLLICAPSRVSELWRMADDIIVLTEPLKHVGRSIPEDEAENLDFKIALVWHPLKNGRPVIKPIPRAMQEVAQDCVNILRDYGDEARKTARWMIQNPGMIPIAEEISDLRKCRDTGTITRDQLKLLLGLPDDKNVGDSSMWMSNFPRTRASLHKVGGGRTNCRVSHYCFRTMQEEWWQVFQKKWKNAFSAEWPFAVNTETYKLRADCALLLFYEGQVDSGVKYKNKLFLTTPSVKTLVNFLGSTHDFKTVFQRLDIRLPDGSYPLIQTHDLRHFLNTMAQRAGIPEPIIAMWSGRRSISQNAAYDHRTDAERLRAHGYQVSDYDEAQVDDLLLRQVGQAFEGTIAPPALEVLSATEASVREMNRRLMISITQFGFCVGDLKSDPCPHAVNCLNCSRLMVCKGAKKAKALIEAKLCKLKGQRNLLRAHVDEGGMRVKNNNVLPHLEVQIAGAEDMLLALNDPNIEDGTMIARKNSCGAVEAGFADRVKLFAAEQLKIDQTKRAVGNG